MNEEIQKNMLQLYAVLPYYMPVTQYISQP